MARCHSPLSLRAGACGQYGTEAVGNLAEDCFLPAVCDVQSPSLWDDGTATIVL
jgi:hypothetical protein